MLLALGVCALPTPALAAETATPLPESEYTAAPACGAPAPAHARCLALALVARTAQARAHRHPLGIARARVPATAPSPSEGFYGLRPRDLHSAYELPDTATGTQTVAIVDAYNDPNAESDLAQYDEEFSLPSCTAASGCFRQVNQNGQASPLPFPQTGAELEAASKGTLGEKSLAEDASGWGVEISLDIETVRAVCQSCHILLVEAGSTAYASLEAAERSAERLGAGEISNSWGGPESGVSAAAESASAFDDPGTVITAAAGDAGYLSWDAERAQEQGVADFPASSPHVVAVGGTRLALGGGGAWAGETVWNGNGAGGGGCSETFAAPTWQLALSDWSAVGCHAGRAVADVAADADPYTGVAVHDTSSHCERRYEEGGVQHVAHWCTIGGTSLASPLIAATFALAGGPTAGRLAGQTLYARAHLQPSALHDVTTGSNGACGHAYQLETGLSGCTLAEEAASCQADLICVAGSGYDGPSGLGTPDGLAAFAPGLPPGAEPAPEPKPEGEGSETPRSQAPSLPAPRSGGVPNSPAGGAPPAAAPGVPLLSGLALTTRAIVALNRALPHASQVAFTFMLNTPTRVRVTLYRRVRGQRRSLWQAVGRALSLAAPSGRTARNLASRALLRHGVYRLTAAPSGGPPRSLQFQLG